MSKRVEQFVEMYQRLDKNSLSLLDDIYHPSIHFIDPLHEVKGLDQLYSYFANMYANVTSCSFNITEHFELEDRAFLYWTMTYQHPRINGGKDVEVQGHSQLRFGDQKVIFHRDYFDVGELLYRRLPVINKLIKMIDKRAGS
ncbi:nuclear transport factor 2 family protein [Pseudoalteromonas sp. SSDWG2]|uniref:nuclear transport factor 2 family protein n=1 Tax=Pseudoalteromonas sp. SSDWG2 TaxID=3139391 RepID=UPI003BAD6D28